MLGMSTDKPSIKSEQTLHALYDELKKIGSTRKELKNQSLVLASDYDGVRTDSCTYFFEGVINSLDGKNLVFTYGKTNRTWRHLAGVDQAVMYGGIDWPKLLKYRESIRKQNLNLWPLYSLPDEEDLGGLTERQVADVAEFALSRDQLVHSWENQLFIRDGHRGWKYITNQIPAELVEERKVSATRTASYQGVPIVLETETRPEEILSEGMVPVGYQEVVYKNDVIQFLVDHVKKKVGI